jgi:hypothetical protein
MISAYLEARYDAHKSFYSKARIEDDGTAVRLYSYGTFVALFHKATGTVGLMRRWDASATTLRHVKEFLAQMGAETGSKARLAELYT